MKVRLPENLSEVKLSQYKRYKKVVMDNQDDEVFCAIQMVAIFCELSVADVMKIPRDQFAEIVEHLAKVLDQRPQLVRTFKMDGVKYGFIPNFEKATIGEYADADSLLNDDERLELLMTVLYRPIKRQMGDVYEIEPYQADEAKAELFKDVRMDVVIGSVLFFLSIKQGIAQTFPALFALQDDGERGAGGFGERWGWYHSFVRIAREIGIRPYECGAEPLYESLTLLSYLKDEAEEILKRNKK